MYVASRAITGTICSIYGGSVLPISAGFFDTADCCPVTALDNFIPSNLVQRLEKVHEELSRFVAAQLVL
jgi:hypothetical protein